ncbi:succinate dehydrogenase, hydrophobic membrane anchor protein [Salinibius halmophilus]|uniref:succinate dehydrogenase, hydrophobic membrane anchor protein n=1 Tax=Salinibius halmophilus TaxID=1853216 RepID=UPI000E66C909|nr:succinate dehydrogenase, hydrophobic membrane anchor protein [Salinibius halmophilus]
MVKSVTNLSRSGLSDWLWQRVSAVIIAAYAVFIVGVLLANPDMDYASWQALFQTTWVQIFSFLAVLAIVGHAWIGLWTVATDYMKPLAVRFIFLAILGVTLFTYLIVAGRAIWGA